MPAYVEVRGATVAYEYVDVTIVATGPYGRRERPCRILFEQADAPLLALLLARCDAVDQQRIAESGGGENVSIIG